MLLVLLTFAIPSCPRAEPFADNPNFDQRLIADVVGTALAFMAPRILEPESTAQLAIWGLRGMNTLDPHLLATATQQGLTLTLSGKTILSLPLPGDNPTAWGQAVAAIARTGWDSSEPVRHAGTTGVIEAFFDELFNHLDPYSRYASPGDAAEEQERRNGRAGVGLDVVRSGRAFVVRSIVPSSPASASPVKPGDTLLAIDGLPLDDADLTAVGALLAGPEDSPVTLTLGAANRQNRDVTLRRTILTPPTVFATRDRDMLVLRVTGFARNTADLLSGELVRGLAAPKPPKAVVLDLRGNRGGLLQQAATVAEMLLPAGQIASTAGRDPAAHHEFRANGVDMSHGLPLVLLVDGRTASAAEVLAAALSDDGRAVVVGSATLGKGLVQTILPLPDGGALSLTWSRVLAPLGWPLQALGVMPQVCTSLGEDNLHRQLDALAQGLQPMQRAIARSRTARAPLLPAEVLEIRNACPASEGRDSDMIAAKFLIDTPAAYDAALIRAPFAP
jgi:carboxyl-terminal processing protease